MKHLRWAILLAATGLAACGPTAGYYSDYGYGPGYGPGYGYGYRYRPAYWRHGYAGPPPYARPPYGGPPPFRPRPGGPPPYGSGPGNPPSGGQGTPIGARPPDLSNPIYPGPVGPTLPQGGAAAPGGMGALSSVPH